MGSELTLAQKAAQLIFPGFTFGRDDPAVAERLVGLGVGGFCLYGGAPAEVARFTHDLQGRARIPLLFCADYEDGAASHVSGATEFPTNMGLGASGNEALAYQKALLTAIEARAMGIRWVLAPVVDLADEPANPIVNVRAFGSDPKLVGRMGKAYMQGLAAERMLSCVKHFPGHGRAKIDSHLRLPLVRRSRAELSANEWKPFRSAVALADSVMTAHLRVPSIGASRHPASMSPAVLSALRKRLGYSGLVTTDALLMNAVAAQYPDPVKACETALKAGNDILLVPLDPLRAAERFPERAEAAGGKLAASVEAAFGRLMRAKAACGLGRDRGRWPETPIEAVGCARHQEAADRMAAECLAWVGSGTTVRSVAYWEPEADSPTEWRGREFVEGLKAAGVEVRPHPEGEGTLVASVFVRPRAYSGHIALSAQDTSRVRKALEKNPESILVSFGSPFVFDQVKGWKSGLCAFGGSDASQRAAACALAGRAPAAGAMPVRLRCMQARS